MKINNITFVDKQNLLIAVGAFLLGGIMTWGVFLALGYPNYSFESKKIIPFVKPGNGTKNSQHPSSDNPTDMSGMMSAMMSGISGKTGDDFDKAFLAQMIVHHTGAINMAEVALGVANHSELKTLAKNIISTQTKEIDQMRGWQKKWFELPTYSSSQYNFSFSYPTQFASATPNYGNLKQRVVQYELNNKQYAKTNFADAAFTVSTEQSVNSEECYQANLPGGKPKGVPKTRIINSVGFREYADQGAAAGNLYEGKVFRLYRNQLCYELVQTVHTTNIGNYEPGTVTEVDLVPIWKQLDGILESFTLTK